ncbi:MAG: filamentous hemagglutinin N-terminal domain-containing protein [Cyanobacteria bacterium J06621_8]
MKLSLTNVFRFLLLPVSYLCITREVSLAQITSDNTVNTAVNQNGNIAEITGGETRGANLFHSFQDFSVPTGNEAFFNNANDIANIFSRVTGGNISSVEGTISANGNASLFLINPAGIIFGEGARLDIGGSFYGSTASSILFEGGEFSAVDLDNPPLLTVNAPIGLNFRDNPGEIINRSFARNTSREFVGLEVSTGNTLALIGGNIKFEAGEVTAKSGRVELGGLSEAGTVELDSNGGLIFSQFLAGADVILDNAADIDVRGNQGHIQINARNLELTAGNFGSSQIRAGIAADSSSENVQAGNIVINATESVSLDNSNVSNKVEFSAVGNAGDISVVADLLLLSNDGTLDAGVEGDGNSGNINISANNIEIDDGTISNTISTNFFDSLNGEFAEGNTGNIAIEANSLLLSNRGTIDASVDGVGIGGNINLELESLSLSNGGMIASNITADGSAGDIDITANNITLDDSTVSSSVSFTIFELEPTQGRAGNIKIATGSLLIINSSSLEALTENFGDGGNIEITASDSVVVDGSNNFVPSLIQTNTGSFFNSSGSGNAGDIEIITPKLSVINNASISAATFNEGQAGNINLKIADLLEVNNGGVIAADVFFDSTGQGGNLTIETNQLMVDSGGQISVTTLGEGNAGNLTIVADDSIEVTGSDGFFVSGLFATSLNANGTGGEANIVTQNLTVADGAVINVGNFPSSESSFSRPGTGEPGNLVIQADSINLEGNGSITAATQSTQGTGANVILQVAEDIILNDGGLISAQAFNEGNGGNLTIDSRFIIAFPNGNNDIIASAEQGQGGNININAQSLFGIEERPLNDLTNDINASSEFSLDGSITINSPDINPLQGTVELPSNIVIPEQTSVQACQANREIAAKNRLIISGRGGVPAAPDLPLDSQNVYVEGVNETSLLPVIPEAIETAGGQIQPARGIEQTESGIILTAYRTNNIGARLPQNKLNCGS